MIRAAAYTSALLLLGCQATTTVVRDCREPLVVIGFEEPRSPEYLIVYRASAKNAAKVAKELEELYGFHARNIKPGDATGRPRLVPLLVGSDAMVVESVKYGRGSGLVAVNLSDDMLAAMRCDRRMLEIAANNYIYIED